MVTGPKAGWSDRAYASYVLAVLTVCYMFTLVDRSALAILLESIKRDLNLADTQLGILTGIASALLFSILGIPIARAADRGNRVTIVAILMVLLGTSVASLGLAATFLQLILIRLVVSAGEAGCVPCSHSLIADYFSRNERSRALALFKVGSPLSLLVGFLAAGLLNERYGWRITFILVGVPGIVLAALVWLTIREPRQLLSGLPGAHARELTLLQVFSALWRIRAYRHLLIAITAWYFFTFGLNAWKPAFFIRTFGMRTGELGAWLALTSGLSGIVGALAGGWLAHRFASGAERKQLVACAVAFACLPFCIVGTYLAPSKHLAFVGLTVFGFGLALTLGPIFGAVLSVAPSRMRATSTAIVYLVANLLGMSFGPLLIGVVSDALSPMLGQSSLRYALVISSPGFFLAAWHLWLASRTIEAAIGRVQRDEADRSEDLPAIASRG